MSLHPEEREGEVYLGHVAPGQVPTWDTTRFGEKAYDHETGREIPGRVPIFAQESELKMTFTQDQIDLIQKANAGFADPCPGEMVTSADGPPVFSLS